MRKSLLPINKIINESNLDKETKVFLNVLAAIAFVALAITILVSAFTDDSNETQTETVLTSREYPISSSEIQSRYISDDFLSGFLDKFHVFL